MAADRMPEAELWRQPDIERKCHVGIVIVTPSDDKPLKFLVTYGIMIIDYTGGPILNFRRCQSRIRLTREPA
jgi:hypothetical protein